MKLPRKTIHQTQSSKVASPGNASEEIMPIVNSHKRKRLISWPNRNWQKCYRLLLGAQKQT